MKCSNGITSLDKLYLSRNVFHLISLPVVFNVNKKTLFIFINVFVINPTI